MHSASQVGVWCEAYALAPMIRASCGPWIRVSLGMGGAGDETHAREQGRQSRSGQTERLERLLVPQGLPRRVRQGSVCRRCQPRLLAPASLPDHRTDPPRSSTRASTALYMPWPSASHSRSRTISASLSSGRRTAQPAHAERSSSAEETLVDGCARTERMVCPTVAGRTLGQPASRRRICGIR